MNNDLYWQIIKKQQELINLLLVAETENKEIASVASFSQATPQKTKA